jgi:hypothetical protein
MVRRQATTEPEAPAGLWIEYRPLDAIRGADTNPKAHDEALLDRSMRRFGFVEPPLEDARTDKLIVGHGRLEAAARARSRHQEDPGEHPVPKRIVVDAEGVWTIPVICGWSSADDTEAAAYLAMANQSVIAGGWRPRALAEFLHAQDQAGADLGDLGFDREGYDALLKDTGLAGELAGDFLGDLAGGDGGGNGSEDDTPPSRGQSTDVVDLRLPMVDRERDEAVSLLRKHQRVLADAGRPAGSLSATALEILRTWTP